MVLQTVGRGSWGPPTCTWSAGQPRPRPQTRPQTVKKLSGQALSGSVRKEGRACLIGLAWGASGIRCLVGSAGQAGPRGHRGRLRTDLGGSTRDDMGEERPWRDPPFMEGAGWGWALGLQLCPHVASLDAHWGCHLQGRVGAQAPPRLAQPPATPNKTQPCTAAPRPPAYRSRGPSGTQSRMLLCPRVHCLDHHEAPTCPGVRFSSVPQRLTPHRGADGTPPWEAGPSSHSVRLGVSGWLGPELEPQRTLPSPSTPQTHVNAILAGLPGGPLGARGAWRSHFLKWRNAVRLQGRSA